MISANASITACYLYNAESGSCWDIYNDSIPYLEKLDIRGDLIELFCGNKDISVDGWYVQIISGKNYLLRIFCVNKI